MTGEFPQNLRYTESDEWVRREGGEVVIGVTVYASDQLGDVVYLQLPDVGVHLSAGDSIGEIESVKAVSELYAPMSGEVIETNDDLTDNPALVNEDPYGRGWIVRLRADQPTSHDDLLDAHAYERTTTERH